MSTCSFNSLGCQLSTNGVLASCSKNGDDVKGTLVTHNDFEGTLGWGGNADASITTEQAHSGKHSIKVGPQSEYGYTYSQTLGKMSATKIKEITLSAWVWTPNVTAPGQFVLSVTRSPELNTPVFYGSVSLPTVVKKAKHWQLVTQTFMLPDSVQVNNLLKFYLWRAGTTENVYADDITLSVGK